MAGNAAGCTGALIGRPLVQGEVMLMHHGGWLCCWYAVAVVTLRWGLSSGRAA